MGDIIRYTDLNNKTLDIAGNSTSVNITWDTVVGNASNETASGNGTCKFENPDGEFDSIWYSVILMTVSLCGVVGNLLTLFVLSRNRILGSMDHLERSATYVLVAMACSDLCFCVAQIPEAVIRDDFAWRPPRDFIKMNVQVRTATRQAQKVGFVKPTLVQCLKLARLKNAFSFISLNENEYTCYPVYISLGD